jgi:hypothetical protein
VEEGKESQQIRAEFVKFPDQVDPVRGQISQPEVEDTPGNGSRVSEKKTEKKRNKQRGEVRLGCWLLIPAGPAWPRGGAGGPWPAGPDSPSSVRGWNFFYSFSNLTENCLLFCL